MLWAGGNALFKRVETTRLGEGLQQSCRLSPLAMRRTAEAVSAFAAEGRRENAQILAFATAAVRQAENGADFCEMVKKACNVSVDVVAGEAEAELGALGALGGGDGSIVDIGGASTELFCRRAGKTALSMSLNVGAVRLFDACGDKKPALEAYIRSALSPLSAGMLDAPVYAVGGTASTIASVLCGLEAYDGARLQNFPLALPNVEELAERLLSMPLEERKAVRGMDPRRADIIAGGALLLANIMETIHIHEVLFSDRDNLEGYLLWRGLA